MQWYKYGGIEYISLYLIYPYKHACNSTHNNEQVTNTLKNNNLTNLN